MKHTILFLAANPADTGRLELDREAHDIHAELERTGHRDRFEFVTRWAVEPLDLLRELRKLRPTVVHFSGHGGSMLAAPPSGQPRRDVIAGKTGAAGAGAGEPAADRQDGLVFQGPDGSARIVSAAAMQATVESAGESVRLVVLNACYSDQHAQPLLSCVDCVVGMTGPILDDAARTFAVGFYGGLGEQQSVHAAYRQARAAILLAGLHDGDRPQLAVRAGVDARRLVLAADPR
jgi:hypothetical protein